MSITLITGVPGSGKTLYAVAQLIAPLIGSVEKTTDPSGALVEIPRVVFTNINGLLLDHEFIDGGTAWAYNTPTKTWTNDGHLQGLHGWHTWAKPGSVVCFDEFQKYWPPRPAGAPVPPDIQALDTHRHMGVDFILITQNCMNVDRHIMGLVDRHLHVRRVANLPLATVYEWDHASKTLNYKNSMAKTPWRFPMSAYKLYKSAQLHTKQRRKAPAVLWFIFAGLCGAAFAFPALKNRISERVAPASTIAPAVAPAPPMPNVGQKVEYSKDGTRYTVESVHAPPQPLPLPPVLLPAAPAVAGCIAVDDRCQCFDSVGHKVDPPSGDSCHVSAGLNGVAKVSLAEERPPAGELDGLVIGELRRGITFGASVTDRQMGVPLKSE